jgi:hypothetical protein
MNIIDGFIIAIFDNSIGCRPSGFESLSLRHKRNQTVRRAVLFILRRKRMRTLKEVAA